MTISLFRNLFNSQLKKVAVYFIEFAYKILKSFCFTKCVIAFTFFRQFSLYVFFLQSMPIKEKVYNRV